MKKINFIYWAIFCILPFNTWGQNFIEVSEQELKGQIDKVFDNLITCDDEISMELINFYLNADKGGKYIIDFEVIFFSNEIGGVRKEVKSQNIVLNQIIQNTEGGSTTFSGGGYKELFGPTQLKNVNYIEIKVGVTNIEDDKTTVFQKFAPLLDKVLPINGAATTILNVLDIRKEDYEEYNKRLVSTINLNIPLNFVEYGLETDAKSRPYISSDETVAIPIQYNNVKKNPKNLKKLGINIINGVSKWISGDQVIKPESENICGAITIQFTKKKNITVPQEFVDKFKDLSRVIEQTTYEDDELIKKCQALISEINEKNKSEEITDRIASNYLLFASLCQRYIEFKKMRKTKTDISLYDIHFIEDYNSWVEQAERIALRWNFKKYGINGIYLNFKERGSNPREYKRLAKVFLPYSLPNTLILHAIDMQTSLHNELAGYVNDKQDNVDLYRRSKKIFTESQIQK